MSQLQEKWLDLYGSEPPKYQKAFLVKRLSYRIQELFYGGLSETTTSTLKKVATEDAVAMVNEKIPTAKKTKNNLLAGTRLVRIWHESRYEVLVQENGFEYDGQNYRSLSAIAKKITGTHWNGKKFFGIETAKKGA
jgi:hypothetical protein